MLYGRARFNACNPQRFFFNHVMDSFTGQTLPDMLGNLPDELI